MDVDMTARYQPPVATEGGIIGWREAGALWRLFCERVRRSTPDGRLMLSRPTRLLTDSDQFPTTHDPSRSDQACLSTSKQNGNSQ
jgi:hypothetical protein